MKRVWAGLLLAALVATACGGDAGDARHGHDAGSESGDAGAVLGEAADSADADREVTVTTSDELRFEPDSIAVSAGEVITFVVVNEGKTQHEFVLGDDAYQATHEEDMADDGHEMGDMENAVTVGPGETAELTWSFSESGDVLYGCHEPGHYDGGMVGTIKVR